MTEAQIQTAIVDYLNGVLPPEAIVAHVPNQVERGGAAARREVQRKKRMGMLPGFPDILLFVDGQGYTIEVKQPGKYPDKIQRRVAELLRAQGIPYEVARSIDDARAILDQWGIRTREAKNA